jgi:stage II sporulation protein D
MRRLLPLAVLAALLGLVPSAGAGTLFVFNGRGWGHAVGMSQWGAFGMAKAGSSYAQILTHYYTGVKIQTTAGRTVGVELASGRTSLLVGSDAAFGVAAPGRKATHAAGNASVTKTPAGAIKVQGISGTFASPATFSATSAPLRLGGSHYRGTLVVSVSGGALRVVNQLGMDLYVRGVVPRESPAWWPAAALRAQAVAARSYALFALLHGGGKCGGAFCPDTRDQVYGGLDGEEASTNDAVTATARQVIVDGNGDVAQAFFHSSSGGRTADSAHVWGGTISYLKSVADPRDLAPENPNRFWRVFKTATQLRAQLGLSQTPTDATVTRNGSDRVASIRASRPGWAAVVPGGDSLRGRLDLKSNRFWLGVLHLSPSAGRIEWGQRVTLSALVRDVANSVLQRKRFGGDWQEVQPVDGAVNLRAAPRITTSYRLASPVVSAVPVRITVEPRLRITTVRARSLSGTMRPRLAGTTVSVQKLVSGSWQTRARGTVNAEGAWTANLSVRPGSYRAVASPGHGFAPGQSPTLKVGA